MGAKQVALHEENPAQRSTLFLHVSKANAAQLIKSNEHTVGAYCAPENGLLVKDT